VKFQYNKTSMQKMEKDLRMRRNALPVLKAKETALRIEIKKIADELKTFQYEFNKRKNRVFDYAELWNEYPEPLSIKFVEMNFRNIAGVEIPVLKNVEFAVRDYSLFANRAWVVGATEILKDITVLSIQMELLIRGINILNETRKKTTQKVNLYEKVQIPEYESAIQKIKRYLDDEENLSRATSKIVKMRRLSGEPA